MTRISGQVTCPECGDIPNGSAVFVYVCKGNETVARQTFQNLTQFPIQFDVQILNLSEEDHDLIVNIENGENLLFTNGKTKIDQSQSLENLNIQVKRLA